MSTRVLSSSLWSEIKRLSRRRGTKALAIAYVTRVQDLNLRPGDVLVVDASEDSIKGARTSAVALQSAYDHGCNLYSVDDLHAKVMVLGDVAVIGSMNSSESSKRRVEAALVTDEPLVVAQARRFVWSLAEQGRRLREADLARLSKIPVKRARHGRSGRGTMRRIGDERLSVRTWIVGMREDKRERPEEAESVAEGEAEAADRLLSSASDIEMVRLTGRGRCREEAEEGDLLVCVWCGSGKTPKHVYRAAPIHTIQDEPHCRRIFYEAYADSQKTRMTWKAFRAFCERNMLPSRISPGSQRLLSSEHAQALTKNWPRMSS